MEHPKLAFDIERVPIEEEKESVDAVIDSFVRSVEEMNPEATIHSIFEICKLRAQESVPTHIKLMMCQTCLSINSEVPSIESLDALSEIIGKEGFKQIIASLNVQESILECMNIITPTLDVCSKVISCIRKYAEINDTCKIKSLLISEGFEPPIFKLLGDDDWSKYVTVVDLAHLVASLVSKATSHVISIFLGISDKTYNAIILNSIADKLQFHDVAFPEDAAAVLINKFDINDDKSVVLASLKCISFTHDIPMEIITKSIASTDQDVQAVASWCLAKFSLTCEPEKMQCIFKGELMSFLVNVWESASFTTRANISLFVISGAIKSHFIPVEHDVTNKEYFEALISIITCVTEFIINAGRADLSFLLLKYAFCIISCPLHGVEFFNSFMQSLSEEGIEIDPEDLLNSCDGSGLSSDASLLHDQISSFLSQD